MRGRRWAGDVGLLLLATLTRMWGLGRPSLWLDEAFSHLFAVLPLQMAWQAIIVDAVHPPLYYLLLRPWLTLAGGSEFALRLPSALAGVLTVALLLRAGRRWLGRRATGWSGLLLAVNPFHIWYSQEARMYALLGLLWLGSLWAFWQAVHRQRPGAWTLLGVLSALAYLTHYFALYLPLVQFAFLVATLRRHHRALARWTLTQAVAALPFAGWLTALYSVGGGTFGIGWIRQPGLSDLLRTLWSFGMAYDGRITPIVAVGLLVWVGLAGWGMGYGGRAAGAQRVALPLLGLGLALPLLATFLLSLRRPAYVDRFFIGSLFSFLLLAGGGLARIPRWPRWAAGLALAGLGIWGTARFHFDPLFAKEDWRGAAAYVRTRERTDDGLALRHFQYVVPFLYYYQGALEPEAVTVNRDTASLDELAAGHRRLWLLFRGRHDDLHHLAWNEPFDLERDEGHPEVRAWLERHPPAEVVAFPGVTLMRFDLVVSAFTKETQRVRSFAFPYHPSVGCISAFWKMW